LKWSEEMKIYEETNELIRMGLEKLQNDRDVIACCDLWLEAWEGIKFIMKEESLVDVREVDDLYEWIDFIPNVVQDLEMTLHNAGLENSIYFEKRIVFCEELVQFCPPGKLIRNNTRRAIGESYVRLGRSAEGVEVFESLIADEPNWSWGHIALADYYAMDCDPAHYDKAVEIIDRASQLPLIDEYDALRERAELYFGEMDDDEKITSYGAKLRRLAEEPGQQTATAVETAQKVIAEKATKIGRNSPCPCGSGKKYKKCCLRA